MTEGILIVDKPAGMTSHDVVARCRRILQTKRIGHTGTLDPFATGVMVVLVGRATRLAQFLDKDQKEYLAKIDFNFATDTGDLTGTPLAAASLKSKVQSPKSENSEFRVQSSKFKVQDSETGNLTLEVESVLPQFVGKIRQTPPMYSAKKVDGKKLYELARKGIEIERKAVEIEISELETVETTAAEIAENQINIRVACSAGTYIRVLAEDIGAAIGKAAHLAALRRTRAGKFTIIQSVTLDDLAEKSAAEIAEFLIAPNAALAHLPQIALTEAEARRVRNGMTVRRDRMENESFVRLTENENLLAVGLYDRAKNAIQPKIVLH